MSQGLTQSEEDQQQRMITSSFDRQNTVQVQVEAHIGTEKVKVKDAQRIIDKEIRKLNKEMQREALKL
jgi:hypothetical protein